jgi:hypothetical protein
VTPLASGTSGTVGGAVMRVTLPRTGGVPHLDPIRGIARRAGPDGHAAQVVPDVVLHSPDSGGRATVELPPRPRLHAPGRPSAH